MGTALRTIVDTVGRTVGGAVVLPAANQSVSISKTVTWYVLRRFVREASANERCDKGNIQSLESGRIHRLDRQTQTGLRHDRGPSKVTEALRIGVVDDAVATEHAVHANAVVEIVARNSGRNVIDVVERVQAVDLPHLGAGQAFPVEAFVLEVTDVRGAKKGQEFNQIRDDVHALYAVLLQDDNRRWKQVLVAVIARWEPARVTVVQLTWTSDTEFQIARRVTHLCGEVVQRKVEVIIRLREKHVSYTHRMAG